MTSPTLGLRLILTHSPDYEVKNMLLRSPCCSCVCVCVRACVSALFAHARKAMSTFEKNIKFCNKCYVPYEDTLKPYILDSLNFPLFSDQNSENLKVIPTRLTV